MSLLKRASIKDLVFVVIRQSQKEPIGSKIRVCSRQAKIPISGHAWAACD